MSHIHDVIVIGAGPSGMAAAKLCKENGLDVVVLEARDRVGGRTYTVKNDKCGWVDLGAAYIGRSQNHALRVIKELGLKLYPVNEIQKLVFFDGFNSQRVLFSNEELPGIGEDVQMDVANAMGMIDHLGESISVHEPWNHPLAAELDQQTFAQFVDKHVKTEMGKHLIRMFINTIVTNEPYESSILWLLWLIKMCGGSRRVFSTTGGAQEFKISGGTNQISELIARDLGSDIVKLNNAVYYLEQDGNGCCVKTLSGGNFRSKYIIMATPPAVQQKIHYNPPLPAMKNQLIQRTPQGSLFKCIVYYDKLAWRPKDMCGTILFIGPDDQFPISFTVDDTKHDGSFPAIIGFIPADRARKLADSTKEERFALITKSFAKAFGLSEAEAKPIHYEEQDWMAEQYSGGGYTMTMPPGVLTHYGKYLKKPFGRVFYAGTETATEWSGYINGAIQAGERATREILAVMGKISPNDVHRPEPESKEYPPIF